MRLVSVPHVGSPAPAGGGNRYSLFVGVDNICSENTKHQKIGRCRAASCAFSGSSRVWGVLTHSVWSVHKRGVFV